MSAPVRHESSNSNNPSAAAQPSSSPMATENYPLTKTRSAGNLLSHPAVTTVDPQRQRMSIDAGSLDRMARSPIIPEHEHGLGFSGLRRIRQQPSQRPAPNTSDVRSSSLNISLPPSRHPSSSFPSGPGTPALHFSEDLSRFPSESLHSFSFAHQSEEFIHNRQNVLKRSIDFMKDRLGWAATNPAIVQAQAKLTGDQDIQSMVELLQRANLIGQDAQHASGLGVLGPITGPAMASGENIFEKSFFPTESPTNMEESCSSGPSRTTSGSSSAFPPNSQAISPTVRVEEEDLSPTAGRTVAEEPSETRSPTAPRPRAALKRTFTDIGPLTIQTQLNEALAQPYVLNDDSKGGQIINPSALSTSPHPMSAFPGPMTGNQAPHGHGSRWAPAAQAIFTTDVNSPWTITSANDLACLVFGVTRAEVRKLGILEVVKEDRRKWLEDKLRNPDAGPKERDIAMHPAHTPPTASLAMGNGVTARLLSKPPSRVAKARSQTDDGVGSSYAKKNVKGGLNHEHKKSRGVLLCGDVVPIQKRNGAVGSASLWVKEKRGGLIWVLEEIAEDIVMLGVDEVGCVTKGTGATEAIWGGDRIRRGMDIQRLIPGIPKLQGTNTGALDYDKIDQLRTFTARTSNSINIPIGVELVANESTFRVSSFPHIAGIIVLSAAKLEVTSSNTVFCSSLFGQAKPEGLNINDMIPSFDRILRVMTDEDHIELVDGIVIPEHSFRRARALLAMREGKTDAAAALFLKPSGLPARHRDGSDIMVDVQMRVVKSGKKEPIVNEAVIEEKSEDEDDMHGGSAIPEKSGDIVYALWVTYSRHLHATNHGVGPVTLAVSRPGTPPHQPSPGQTVTAAPDIEDESDDSATKSTAAPVSMLSQQLAEAQKDKVPNMPDIANLGPNARAVSPPTNEKPHKKTISDFSILEEMGQGAYGQVKLCRYKNNSKKVVIKYVTKRRILVDTWTRDRRLGTVPLEIHVLDYLRRDGFKHPNIVEMADFFEDDTNYYIEMVPHGLPGMDLFDYIELRVNMEELECRSIFIQVAEAIHHLHTKAKVVHRDIKDENVILDGEGNIKLIDFGSAAYIKNGPFDVFVGTIDYAAPEVLAGKSYRGKEQDVWALGILLYTIVYKENPFYSIDEIMDHDLRVPYIMSDESIDLIRQMLNRDVENRVTIGQVLEHPWCHMKIDK